MSPRFPDGDLCPVCRVEAALVRQAVVSLGGPALVELDVTVRELLASKVKDLPLSPSGAEPDSLDQVERLMALEEEYGSGSAQLNAALEEATSHHVFTTLLGSASVLSTWDPLTIWMRSLRGIVVERAKRRGDCTCGEPEHRAALPDPGALPGRP